MANALAGTMANRWPAQTLRQIIKTNPPNPPLHFARNRAHKRPTMPANQPARDPKTRPGGYVPARWTRQAKAEWTHTPNVFRVGRELRGPCPGCGSLDTAHTLAKRRKPGDDLASCSACSWIGRRSDLLTGGWSGRRRRRKVRGEAETAVETVEHTALLHE